MTGKNANENKKRERRDRTEDILREATRLFSMYGFRGTTLAAVAKAVDLTEPGLLHYFPSKVKLLQGVLEYREQQDAEKYHRLFEQGEVSPFELLEQLVAENETKPAIIQLFTVMVGESIDKDHPSHDFFVNRYAQTRTYLAENVGSERFPADCDLEQLAMLTAAVMDGLQIQWLLDPDNVSMSETFHLFSKMIRNYLKNHED